MSNARSTQLGRPATEELSPQTLYLEVAQHKFRKYCIKNECFMQKLNIFALHILTHAHLSIIFRSEVQI
jgi:hypothetical protein